MIWEFIERRSAIAEASTLLRNSLGILSMTPGVPRPALAFVFDNVPISCLAMTLN